MAQSFLNKMGSNAMSWFGAKPELTEEEKRRLEMEASLKVKQAEETAAAIEAQRASTISGAASPNPFGGPMLSVGAELDPDSVFARALTGTPNPKSRMVNGSLPNVEEPREVKERTVVGPTMTANVDPQTTSAVNPESVFPPAPSAPDAPVSEEQGNALSGFWAKLGADTDEKRQAAGMSLMKAGAAMMGHSSYDGNFWEALGAGVTAGTDGYSDTIQQQQKDKITNEKLSAVKREEAVNAEIASIIKANPNWASDPVLRSRIASLQASIGDLTAATKTTDIASSKPFQFDKTYFDGQGNQWTQRNNPNNGTVEYVNAAGEKYDPQKHGQLSLEFAKRGQRDFKNDPVDQADRKGEAAQITAGQRSTRNITLADDIEDAASILEGGIAPGTGGFNEAMKRVDSYLGGTDALKGSVREKIEYLTQQQLAQEIETMRGLGPMTDKDIDMLRGRILSGNLSPEGLRSIAQEMRTIQRYAGEKTREWNAYRRANPDAPFFEWSDNYDVSNYNSFKSDKINGLSVRAYDVEKTRRANGGDPAQTAPTNNLREGQTGTTKDGRRVVVRNGRWVPAN
ncbi:hypothetical protein FY134_03145 [Agrobacterium fabrum]|uniref:hypothetical protein n=1 Tax=Agrobacterium fabrum TaxID=1176649 RepID=UPI0021D37812|nr:hypothetical protein [Agrobacterium fabrum]UXT56695.1 hypothetical protein FY134_03145 [Agrobacterium fabrum]